MGRYWYGRDANFRTITLLSYPSALDSFHEMRTGRHDKKVLGLTAKNSWRAAVVSTSTHAHGLSGVLTTCTPDTCQLRPFLLSFSSPILLLEYLESTVVGTDIMRLTAIIWTLDCFQVKLLEDARQVLASYYVSSG